MKMNKELTFDLSNELIDVSFVVVETVVSNRELSVRSKSSTVTVGQIVNDNLDEVFLAGSLGFGGGIGEVCSQLRSFGNNIEPGKGWDVSNRRGLSFQGRIGNLSGSSLNLRGVEGRQVNLQKKKFSNGSFKADIAIIYLVTSERVSSVRGGCGRRGRGT